MNKFPEKFSNLHRGEEFVRVKSIEIIENDADLQLHICVAEKVADLIYHFVYRDEHTDEDDLVVRLLGIRMFNCINAALKLLLSGYYQASVLEQRDLMETFFLLDYFLGDKSLIERWRKADKKTLKKDFSPAAVRKALDLRGGLTGNKREEAYKLFSTIAGHPNPQGFTMLMLPTGEHHCGPFLEEKALKTSLAELGKGVVQAGINFGSFFDNESKGDFKMKLAFLECQHAWLKKFFNVEPINHAYLEKMREDIDKLPD